MQKFLFPSVLILFILGLTGCEAIGDIFQAGFSVGIFVVIAIIAIILFFVFKAKK